MSFTHTVVKKKKAVVLKINRKKHSNDITKVKRETRFRKTSVDIFFHGF